METTKRTLATDGGGGDGPTGNNAASYANGASLAPAGAVFGAPDDQAEWLALDSGLLNDIWARRRKTFRVLAPVLFLAMAGAAMVALPRNYTASASIAIQGASGGGGLSTLLGAVGAGSGGQRNYEGVLKSRKFAEVGARAAGVQSLYGLKSFDEAVDKVQDAIAFDDKKDGLQYINVTLPGTPRLGSATVDENAKRAAQKLANVYVQSLQTYLSSTNSDHDAALLRQAQTQFDEAQKSYDAAIDDIEKYIVQNGEKVVAGGGGASGIGSSGGVSGMGGASGGGASGQSPTSASATAAGELIGLYQTRGGLEIRLRAAEAARRATTGILGGGANGNLNNLPSEDPLLTDARRDVRFAKSRYDDLREAQGLADTNPLVVAAKENLRLAEERLTQQSGAIQTGGTSDAVNLSALQSQYDTVNRQITDAERKFKVGQNATAGLLRRQNTLTLRLEALKAIATQYGQLRVTAVAGDNLMDVVDRARLPEKGKPGLTLIGAGSAVLTGFLLLLWLALEYLLKAPAQSAAHWAARREAASRTAELRLLNAAPLASAEGDATIGSGGRRGGGVAGA